MANLIGIPIPVLDKGYVELQDMMPHPALGVSGDLAIVGAARVSFLGDSKGPEQDKRLLQYLMRNNHTSPFEMVEFKFRIKAPMMVWWQWVRHRTFHYQSVNSQSGRYTLFDEDEFYIPDVWRRQSVVNKQGSDGEVEEAASIAALLAFDIHAAQSFELYKQAIAVGIAKEQARLFLSAFAAYYTWIVKVDALNLMHFFKLRMAPEAQFEIREYARVMYDHFFKPLLPWTAEAFETYWFNTNTETD